MTKRKAGAAQTVTMPTTDLAAVECALCKAVYLDTNGGHDAHQTVFGHQPAVESTVTTDTTEDA